MIAEHLGRLPGKTLCAHALAGLQRSKDPKVAAGAQKYLDEQLEVNPGYQLGKAVAESLQDNTGSNARGKRNATTEQLQNADVLWTTIAAAKNVSSHAILKFVGNDGRQAIDCVVCVYRVCTVCCSVKYVYGAVNPAVTV